MTTLTKDHNNHPAHAPLTTRRLHQMRDILSKAAAQRDGGNLGYAMADAVKVIDEVLAGRNAAPVADVITWNKEGEERTCDIRWRRFDVQPGPLYTTPPSSPLIPDELRKLIGVLLNSDGHRGADFDLLDYLKARDDIVDILHSTTINNS